MPKLWNDTIEAHRRAVRDATLDAAAALVAEQGLLSVTMSRIAEMTGIGRATLYKYFPDVEAILLAWHERQISSHLEQLARVRAQPNDPVLQLEAVLTAYALIAHESSGHHDGALAGLLHRGAHMAPGEEKLRDLIRNLLIDAAASGEIRDDVAPAELTVYCLSALAAARTLPSGPSVRRLVTVTLAGLRPPADRSR